MNSKLSKIAEQNRRLRESFAKAVPALARACEQAGKAFENFGKACQRIKMQKR